MNGLPDLRLLPDAPVPDGRTVLTALDTIRRRDGHGSRAASRPFILDTNPLERSLGELKRRTKVIGRFPGETSCLTLVWAVLDLYITHAKNGVRFSQLEHQRLRQMRYAGKRTNDRRGGERRLDSPPPKTCAAANLQQLRDATASGRALSH